MIDFDIFYKKCALNENFLLKDLYFNSDETVNLLLWDYSTYESKLFSLNSLSKDQLDKLNLIWPNAYYYYRDTVNSNNPLSLYFNQKELFSEKIDNYRFKTVVDRDRPIEHWLEFFPFKNELDQCGHWIFKHQNDKVEYALSEIGYIRKGIENNFIGKKINWALSLVDEIHPAGMLEYSHQMLACLEEKLEINLTDHAKALRMILLELVRVSNLLASLTRIFYELNDPQYLDLTQLNLALKKHLSRYSGGASLKLEFCFGGVYYAPKSGWINDCLDWLNQAKQSITYTKNVFVKNRDLLKMLKDKKNSAKMAIESGLTGQNLRACGVNKDLRKKNGLYFYSQVDYDVALGMEGQSYDRVLVRLIEALESISIIEQIVENLPPGEVHDEELRVAMPELLSTLSNQHLYFEYENCWGESILNFSFNDELRLTEFRVRTPSFANYVAQHFLMKGLKLEDLTHFFTSMANCSVERER
jgi:NADH:ubiquinone oxidoreductase subunit D